MKKFAIIAAVVAGFLGVTAAAEAGYYTKRCVGYDHCGRPVYRTVYVETCAPRYSGGYYGGGYYGGGGVSFYYSSGRSYCAPRYYNNCRPSYGYRYGRCR
ncbi:hypothetical protein DES53_10452 [Roseimicrobium gellanilyticum]|uniref:Uncharacterized protein n=1 Tax=Roseimicrobium gellanilyticum TaxID=748857 RepID=A0A366HMC6_9BACT|nr:hypothetical protein [Roseimicrobium gellanilyticum]RBP44233.1 hypothetical protein DES53_10452 [Roseimicrobium gellanilyticum]